MINKNFTKSAVNVKKINFKGLALQYRQRCNWQSIPMIPLKKMTFIKWNRDDTTHQTKLRNASAVHQDFKKWGHAHVGIITGKVSGVVILDFDDRGEYERFKDEFELPDTLRVKTGRKPWGRWLIYKYPEGVGYIKGAKRFAHLGYNEVDVKADGGLVPLPPTLYKDGKTRYEWLDGLDPLKMDNGDELSEMAELPEKVLHVLNGSVGDMSTDDEVDRVLDGVPDGQRNDVQLVPLAKRYANKDFTVKEIYIHLKTANKNNVPPETDKRLKDIAKWAFKGRQEYLAKSGTPKAFGPTWSNGNELLKEVIPPLKWIVPDIIPAGVTLLCGKPKAGKSAMAQNIGVNVATGGRALNYAGVEQGDVVFLSLEDGKRRLQSRLKKLTSMMDNSNLSRFHTTHHFPDGEGCIKYLREKLEKLDNPRLVVVDTLKKIKSRKGAGNRGLYDVDYESLEPFVPIADEFDIGIIIVHHLRKGSFLDEEDPTEMISGSTGLTAATDCNHVLERIPGGNKGILHVSGNDINPQSFKMVLEPNTMGWAIDGEANVAADRLTDKQRQVYDAFYHPRAFGGRINIRDIAGITELSDGYVRETLRRLVKKQLIEGVGNGIYQLPMDIEGE